MGTGTAVSSLAAITAAKMNLKLETVATGDIPTSAVPVEKLDGAAWALIKAFQLFQQLKTGTYYDTKHEITGADGIRQVILQFSSAISNNSPVYGTTARFTVTAGKTAYLDYIFACNCSSIGVVGIRNITDSTNPYIGAAPIGGAGIHSDNDMTTVMKVSVAATKVVAAAMNCLNYAPGIRNGVVIVLHEE